MNKNYYRKNIDLSEAESRQVLTIGDSLIEKGFLRHFSGDETKVLIYLLTHLKAKNQIEIEVPSAAGALGLEIDNLNKKLNNLTEIGVIKAQRTENENFFSCYLNLDKILKNNKEKNSIEKSLQSGVEIREKVIKSNSVSKNEIAAALISFLAPANRNIHHREEIKSWLNDFENKMLKELVRRVDKWLKRQGQEGNENPAGAYAYLKAIINNWYQKEITSYEKLQKQDKLHRETKELARAYGINAFSSNTAQLKTFQSWLSGKQALSKEIALRAIREAVRRKRDGQPSLKYVEDNFINPIKELGINNTADFRRWLEKEMDQNTAAQDKHDKNSFKKKNNKTKKSKSKAKNKDENNYKWKDFFIDFDKYKE